MAGTSGATESLMAPGKAKLLREGAHTSSEKSVWQDNPEPSSAFSQTDVKSFEVTRREAPLSARKYLNSFCW
jgi:hypothetical protein